jgi:acetylornithine deacetylase
MSIDAALIDHLKASLDRDAAIGLLSRSVGTPSVTGTEAPFAQLLAGELNALGAADVTLTEFAPGRPNVRGYLPGAGGGPKLLLTGHTDTVHVRGWAERWAGTERESPYAAAIVDGEMWGRGTGDLKAGICTAIMAARLLTTAGIKAPADLIFAFIGDEESGEPGSGVSAGFKNLVEEIEAGAVPTPDFAVYVEPTQLNVYTAQMGFLICDITVTGQSAYFGVPELGVDALKASHAILTALFNHSVELESRAPHELVDRPFVLVTTLEGGGYIAVPGECYISLILKLIPGEGLDRAAADLEAAVRAAPVDPAITIAFSYPAGRDHAIGGTPSEISPELPAVRLLTQAVKAVRPDRGGIQGAPYWSEAPFLINRLGVPAVYCAPGDIRVCHTLEERISVQEYLDGIIAFAAFLASFGGSEHASFKGHIRSQQREVGPC